MLLAIVDGVFQSTFRTEYSFIHVYSEDFTKNGKQFPSSKQEIFEYVWSIPGIIKADITYAPFCSTL